MIYEPLKIKSMNLSSRLVMPPLASAQSTQEGLVTAPMLSYYGERAASGHLGLIITEHSFISLQGKASEKQLSLSREEDIPGLTSLVEEIHQKGTKAMAQLNHAGSAAHSEVTGQAAVSASALPLPIPGRPYVRPLPEALTEEGIQEIISCFAQAAGRAKKAGYDAVEIHSAHGYLLNQFYSPLTNHRTDAYGGSLAGRLRLHREVLAAVRSVVGIDYPIALRLGGCDYMAGGSTIEDCVEAAKLLEADGLDLLDLSGGLCRYTREGHAEAGYFQDMSSAVKEAVSLPVILTGGVKTAKEAEALLASGAADLIGVGRALLQNPRWPEGAEE